MSVVKVASGGLPVTIAASGFGMPCYLATTGVAITLVVSGGLPIVDGNGPGGGIGSGIQLSNATFPAASAAGTAIGTLSVIGGSGTYTFTLTNNAGGKTQVAGTNGVNLQAGATLSVASSYSITVNANNGAGSVFNATFLITALLLTNTVPPAITGTAAVGSVLTVSNNGTWVGVATINFTYQWQRNGVAIGGATANTYTLVVADYGMMITCAVTGTNAGGSATATSNAVGAITATGPANTVAPVVTGTTSVGSVLSVSTGTWTGTPTITYTYQWLSNGTSIGGATSNTYTLASGDTGAMISATVLATNVVTTASATSAAVGPITSGGGGGTDDTDYPTWLVVV